ncbi:phosphatase PAP2 family protein [Nocardioides sp. BP30]|uniref:bifunctional phosphatase PAP2/O-acyltransferase family protein n=1 Tax=Nocardioides sp. BP30 TaxID=3036374 RepID=UPI00246966B0|nr:phosphatase PAP2 family protein [Nocardioides sp. BP30]WGL53020.1 phosphatase PAP2 family protein [Nocardioides sp. BP30]
MPEAGRRLSVRRIVVWRQVALGLLLFGYYLLVDSLESDARRARADRNGRWLLDLEQRLRIDVEKTLNDWLARHDVLQTLANYEYAYTYILSALAAFVFLLWKRQDLYRRARTAFVLLTGVGITCFLLFPTTPPRMLPGNTFYDTVTHGHTVGSWGSSVVAGANELAAMPSLHMAWALWVSVVLAAAGARGWLQVLSAVHVLVTLLVIMSTANHYLLDAVAAFVLVWAADRVAGLIHPADEHEIVASADAFFLHVEETGAPQIVGGLVIYEGAGGVPSLAEVREVIAGELPYLPRFTQRVRQSRWRRPQWVPAGEVDWDWHLRAVPVADRAGVHAGVAALAAERMPRDRPLWRAALFEQPSGERAFVILMHHTIADGIGTVLQALRLLRPLIRLPAPPSRPTALQTGLATAVGFAQLATDGGRPRPLGTSSDRRSFTTTGLPMTEVKQAASGRRVTDLLLALTAGAIADAQPELVERSGGTLRIAVPLMVRAPDAAAEGNATAAVMVDVPLRGAPTEELYDEISRRTARLRTPTRALASRWVMAHLLRIFPEPAVGWFARTVYGHRFFHGIVSNMPGPTEQLSMAGIPLVEVYPVLPLAPGSPFVLGALSWHGVLSIGLATDPALIDADRVAAAMVQRLEALGESAAERLSPNPAPATTATARVESPAARRTDPGAAPAGS